MEYDSIIKMNGRWIHAKTWMKLENMPNEKNETQRPSTHMIPFI